MVRIDEIQEGDEVLSLNKNTGLVEYHLIKALADMGVKEVYELKTKSGRVIRTTGNHPYLVNLRTQMAESAEQKTGQNQESVAKKFIRFARKYITNSRPNPEISETREKITPQVRDIKRVGNENLLTKV